MTFAMIIQDFGGQLEHFYRNMHILPKMSHLTPRGAYVLNYSLGQGIYFEQLLICFNFNMTFVINIQYFDVKLTHFLSKNVYFAENVRLDPLGCLCMDLPPEAKAFILKNS